MATLHPSKFLNTVRKRSQQFLHGLTRLQRMHPVITEIRGRGLMIGLELSQPGAPIVESCRRRGLLINCTQERVLRIMPALTVTLAEVSKALQILDTALNEVR